MFEHLDDPHPPAFGDGFRRTVVRRALERRRHRRLVGGACAAVASLVVGVGGLYGRAAWRSTSIERVDVAGTGTPADGEPVTVLLVGTEDHDGGVGGVTDTLLLTRFDPRAGAVAFLSVPRDLMVDPPGGGEPRPIGQVGATAGGLQDVVGLVASEVGVPVDHVVAVDMTGFTELVDRIGGLDVRFDRPVRDRSTGLLIDDPGCVSLDGEETLALVRSRRVEVLDEAGTWVRDPLSDLSRVEVQQQVVRLALASAVDAADADPLAVNDLVDWAVEHLSMDEALGVRELADLARAGVALGPDDVSHATLPVVPYPADVNRLIADPDRAPAVIDAFTSGRPLPPEGLPVDQGPDAPGPFGAGLVAPC